MHTNIQATDFGDSFSVSLVPSISRNELGYVLAFRTLSPRAGATELPTVLAGSGLLHDTGSAACDAATSHHLLPKETAGHACEAADCRLDTIGFNGAGSAACPGSLEPDTDHEVPPVR
jgi:hypothetical protein